MTLQKINTPIQSMHDEHILVVKRDDLLKNNQLWHGIHHENIGYYLDVIGTKKEFLPRSIMETDPTYKQIIPYIIFHYQNRYFLMQRQAKASETRLQNKFTLGIGGHVRETDMEGNSIIDWARREFHEEVCYADSFTVETLGLINDDTNDVGRVHLGLLIMLHGSSPAISVRSELKSGQLVTVQECAQRYEYLESWSQMVFDYLQAREK